MEIYDCLVERAEIFFWTASLRPQLTHQNLIDVQIIVLQFVSLASKMTPGFLLFGSARFVSKSSDVSDPATP